MSVSDLGAELVGRVHLGLGQGGFVQQLSAVDRRLADGVCVLSVAENVFRFLLVRHLRRSSQTAERSVSVNNDPVNMSDPS